jgi:hypothetical protein
MSLSSYRLKRRRFPTEGIGVSSPPCSAEGAPMNREANRKMLSATSESGSSKTTGRPLFRQVGTRRLDDSEPFAWHTDREQGIERLREVFDPHDVEHRYEADGVRQVEAGQGEVRVGRRRVDHDEREVLAQRP